MDLLNHGSPSRSPVPGTSGSGASDSCGTRLVAGGSVTSFQGAQSGRPAPSYSSQLLQLAPQSAVQSRSLPGVGVEHPLELPVGRFAPRFLVLARLCSLLSCLSPGSSNHRTRCQGLSAGRFDPVVLRPHTGRPFPAPCSPEPLARSGSST